MFTFHFSVIVAFTPFKMHLSFLTHAAAVLSLASVAQAGQHPLNLDLRGDFCSVTEKDNLLLLSQLRERQDHQHCSPDS